MPSGPHGVRRLTDGKLRFNAQAMAGPGFLPLPLLGEVFDGIYLVEARDLFPSRVPQEVSNPLT